MNRLTIRQAADALGYKSTKSAVRFCRNNQVPVFTDMGARGKYVLKTDFDLARLRATISHLRNRYGESHWQDALKAHLADDLLGLLTVMQFKKRQDTSQVFKQGTHAEKFLSDLNTALKSAV